MYLSTRELIRPKYSALRGHLGGGSLEEDDDATVDPSNSEPERGTVNNEIFESFVLEFHFGL